MSRFSWPLIGLLSACILLSACTDADINTEKRLLVFSKTAGYRHKSIPTGQQALMKLAAQNNIPMDTTEDASYFTEDSLKRYSAVIFLNTTGDVLNHIQQADFERYIQSGGGYVGIHAASDTEYQWPWYGKLMGGYFRNHPNNPNVRDGTMTVVDRSHISTQHLPETWKRKDEYYDYKSFNKEVNVLVTVDERSYDHGDDPHHPMSWYHEFDGGRAFYTNFGHTSETFSEDLFLKHLWGGIEYAIGKNARDYKKAVSLRVPEENRFIKAVYASGLDEPMELALLPNDKILFIERKGGIKVYDLKTEQVKLVHTLPVHHKYEDGLLGLALDPNFDMNGWLYLFYSPIGEESVQHVSRFTYYTQDSLDLTSEKVIIKIPVQREECCHSAGSLEFGPDGNLFIAVGDNTNPFNVKTQPYNSDGYAPLDERPGRAPFDAQKSAGNLNDLRGGILRITPTPEGSYTIPDGNLLPKDGSQGRPELYVKGCRNPYRIAIDSRKKWLFWGDVGPDAGKENETRGPRGHDEMNVATKPGYFGWPYFVGNNKPYKHYDYVTGKSSEKFYDPQRPVNTSPNNTGPEILPPAQPALVWYPYTESKEFPLVDKGGRNAMAGPTYYYDEYTGENKLPKYYDNKVLVYDWMRGWMMALTLDETGKLEKMEPFLPNMEFSNLTDIVMSDEGEMYILEYGKNWFSANSDARLSRIDYSASNRNPIAKIKQDLTVGAHPFTVNFSAEDCFDYDKGQELSYRWNFENSVEAEGEQASHTFEKPGIYEVQLTVIDSEGGESIATSEISVGNEPPKIDLAFAANQSFYWDQSVFPYEIRVNDREDGAISKGVEVYFDYQAIGYDKTLIEQGHKQTGAILDGSALIDASDCKACHNPKAKSIGPSYFMIAERYDESQSTIKTIAGKIINGGNGNWGDQGMAAHPQLSQEEAEAMATYLLNIDKKTVKPSLPLAGELRPNEHRPGEEGKYTFKVSYTDRGANGIERLNTTKVIELRAARVQGEDYDSYSDLRKRRPAGGTYSYLDKIRNGSWFSFEEVDLSGIRNITLRVSADEAGYTLELRTGSPEGTLLGQTAIPNTQGKENWREITLNLDQPQGQKETLYFVAVHGDPETKGRMSLDWLYFNQNSALFSMQ